VNIGAEPARMLVVFTPAGMERFFDRFAGLAASDLASFGAIGKEAGMEIVGPPLARA
jgi:hypothetical protein